MHTLVKFKLQNKASKVSTKIYILPCTHISFKIIISHIQTTHASAKGATAPPVGGGGARPTVW
jgi:hypothetical protein